MGENFYNSEEFMLRFEEAVNRNDHAYVRKAIRRMEYYVAIMGINTSYKNIDRILTAAFKNRTFYPTEWITFCHLMRSRAAISESKYYSKWVDLNAEDIPLHPKFKRYPRVLPEDGDVKIEWIPFWKPQRIGGHLRLFGFAQAILVCRKRIPCDPTAFFLEDWEFYAWLRNTNWNPNVCLKLVKKADFEKVKMQCQQFQAEIKDQASSPI